MIVAPTFKLGRRKPVAIGPNFKVRNYFLSTLPDPPASCKYSPAAAEALNQMYLNDVEGDCVIAGMCHVDGVLRGNSGEPAHIFRSAEINDLYSAIGGYVPGNDATDNGCDEVTALNYWQSTGATNLTKIAGWLAVDPTNPLEIQRSLWLFENLIFGMPLPDEWITPFPSSSGFIWDVAGPPNAENGHCVVAFDYDDKIVSGLSSWAMLGGITYAAIAKYANRSVGGGLYTALSPLSLMKASKKAPNGFDWSQLMADFDSMGGSL